MEQDGSATMRGRGLVVLGITLAVGVALALAWRARAPRPSDHPGIAVLPIANRGESPDDAYLAPGIQDELTRLLSRVGALRVTSRSATARYARTPPTAPQIGRQLGVDYLLEGSVKRSD